MAPEIRRSGSEGMSTFTNVKVNLLVDNISIESADGAKVSSWEVVIFTNKGDSKATVLVFGLP